MKKLEFSDEYNSEPCTIGVRTDWFDGILAED